MFDPPGSPTEHQLQEALGTSSRAERFYRDQMLDHLNDRMCAFIQRMEMVFVSTADGCGECDVTFRAGPPGVVRVIDDVRLAWPEYRGNGVMASLGNVSENPHVGLLFIDFFRDIVGLHVNGDATIVEAGEFAEAQPDHVPEADIPGRRPERWVLVTVKEAYIHCSKHIPRLMHVPRQRQWGSDDVKAKGGDAFGVAAARKSNVV